MTEKEQIKNLEKLLGRSVRMFDKVLWTLSRRPLTDNEADPVFQQIKNTVSSITARLDNMKGFDS